MRVLGRKERVEDFLNGVSLMSFLRRSAISLWGER